MTDLPPEIAMLAGSVNSENAKIMQMAESRGKVSDPETGATLGDSLGISSQIGIDDLMTQNPPEINNELPSIEEIQRMSPQTKMQETPTRVSRPPTPTMLQGAPSPTDIFHPNLHSEILTKLNKICLLYTSPSPRDA